MSRQSLPKTQGGAHGHHARRGMVAVDLHRDVQRAGPLGLGVLGGNLDFWSRRRGRRSSERILVPLKDEQVVLVAEVAVDEVAPEAAAGAAQGVQHTAGLLGSSASIVTGVPRLPSAGAQNSGIRMMSGPKFHPRGRSRSGAGGSPSKSSGGSAGMSRRLGTKSGSQRAGAPVARAPCRVGSTRSRGGRPRPTGSGPRSRSSGPRPSSSGSPFRPGGSVREPSPLRSGNRGAPRFAAEAPRQLEPEALDPRSVCGFIPSGR